MLDFAPRSRDTLSRGFLIGEEIAHAKDAKPRRRSGRRRGTQRNTGDLFFIGEGIAHAKAAKPRHRSGRRRGTQRNTGDLFLLGKRLLTPRLLSLLRPACAGLGPLRPTPAYSS